MRILAVVYCYPPLLVPAAMCYLKLVASLVENGVEVEILRIDPDTFDFPGDIPKDESLAEVAPPGLVEHVVRSPESTWKYRLAKRLDRSRRFTCDWLEPKKREWLVPARELLDGLDLGRFDAVLTCSQPHANHLLGLELQAATGLPWIAYFSDPWTDNPYQSFPNDRVRAHHRTLEDEVLGKADLVLFTCEEMRRLVLDGHAALDEGRSGVIPHSFVPDWYRDPPDHLDRGPIRLLHTGSFYGPRTPLPLIDALRRVRRRCRLEGAIVIDHYGGIEARHVARIADLGLDEVFRVSGFVDYLQSLALMRDADGLLLVDAPLTSTAQSVFLPSKLIDYLGAGVPIVAVTPGNGASARVVRETGGLLVPLETPAELDRVIESIVEERVIPVAAGRERAGEYDYRKVGADLAAMLARVTGVAGGKS